jgi:hypothetical protein
MATYHELPVPPKPKGTTDEYLKELYNYLFRLKDTMQAVVNGLQAQHEEGGTANANPAER